MKLLPHARYRDDCFFYLQSFFILRVVLENIVTSLLSPFSLDGLIDN